MKTVLVWILALLAGAVVPAVLAALAYADVRMFAPVFLVALSHAFVLGVPAALLCRNFGLLGARWALLGGFLIGAIPTAIYLWPIERAAGFNTTLPEYLLVAGGLGCLGALGAFAFWTVFRLTGTMPRAR